MLYPVLGFYYVDPILGPVSVPCPPGKKCWYDDGSKLCYEEVGRVPVFSTVPNPAGAGGGGGGGGGGNGGGGGGNGNGGGNGHGR